MPLLIAEAEKLSQEDMTRGIIEEFINTDAMFQMLPFTGTSGKAYVYNREKTLAQGNWLDAGGTVQESSSTFDPITTQLRILIGDIDIDKFLNRTMSDVNSQLSVQIAAKVKGMSQQYRSAIINGETGNKQFDGMKELVTASQTLSAGTNGNALSFTMLDELVDAVATGADALVMRKGTFRAYKALLRAAGGVTPQMIEVGNFGIQVPSHDGTPILINDYISGADTQGSNNNTCSIYAAKFDEADGLHGIHDSQTPAGFELEELGTLKDKDATRTRIKTYTGLALKSTKSLAAVTGITNI